MRCVCGVEKHRLIAPSKAHLSGGELGHGLGAFRHGMLGQLPGEGQTNCRLDFLGTKGLSGVDLAKLACECVVETMYK